MEDENPDIPPLDDLSEDLKRLGIIHEPAPDQKKEESRPFGGFSRGFLTKSSSKSAGLPESKAESSSHPFCEGGRNSGSTMSIEDIPFIRKNPGANETSNLEQLQQQLLDVKECLLAERQGWLTEDLFQNLQKDAVLRETMSDPKFVELLKKYPDRPEDVLKRYKDLPELRRFLKKFCLLMGEHFTQIGEKHEKEKAKLTGAAAREQTEEDLRKLHAVMERPHVKEALADPNIKRLLVILHENPGSYPNLYQSLDAETKRKVNLLADAGIFAFTTEPPSSTGSVL